MMSTRIEAEELLDNLFANPGASLARARDMLAAVDDPAVLSIAHQVVGIVLRDRGETEAALAALRTAARLARRSGEEERVADARATLGGTLATAGRVHEGLALLDRAADALTGVALARVLVRRAWVLSFLLERFEEGADDLRRALEHFEQSGDAIWEARALHLEGVTLAGLGDLSAARRAFERSGAISGELGNAWNVAVAVHATGWVGFVEGDLPLALERYADASARWDAQGITSVDLVYDRCGAYLAGGLARDALDVVERALVARPLQARERADLLLALAGAALAANDVPRATSAADEARLLFRRQGRDLHWIRAELLAIWARAEGTEAPGGLLRRAERLIDAAQQADATELPQALLLGARLANEARSARAAALADTWLDEAAAYRGAGIGTTRALGWLALAQRRALSDDAGGVLRACDRGLSALDEHQATLGSQELRALATGHGAQLAALGTRTALASGDARRLLRWAERWRATALTVPAATQDRDTETAADLAALRAQHHRLEQARTAGEPTERMEARAARLEHSVRQRLLQTRGTGASATTFDVATVLDALAEDDTVLVELVEVDGDLHALVAGRGRVRRFAVGDAASASAALEFADFTLRRAARGGRSQLDVAGARLERALLGRAAAALGDARVVVSGTSALQGVPWGILPALADRPVTSTPSARLWMRARAARPVADGKPVFLVGPGLGSGGAEVPVVAAQEPEAVVLDGDRATVEASLAALDGASLAHVAAHGHFRDDSPLFSSLTMADGPLLVHDLQRLKRPPHRVVLSACESGVMKPVGAQELLGLAAALLSQGTAGVVSSLAEVNDQATVEVMVALHASLRTGGGLGDALLAARTAAAGDPVLAATAAAFTVLGT